MYYKNPITRFLLRKNWLRRVRMRLDYYRRLITKDAFADLKLIFTGKDVESILDVGANIGFVTYQFQQYFPQAHIYAFEPNPLVFRKLETGYQGDSKVHLFNYGVADVNGQLSFNVNANTGTSSFLQPSPYHHGHQAKNLLDPITVDVITIEDFANQQGITHINILKMDIEGYELKALQGAESLLSQQRIDAIYTEVSLVPQYIGQPLFHDITEYLQKRGYYLYNIYDFVAQETLIRQALIGNVTYISANHREFLEKKHGTLNCGW